MFLAYDKYRNFGNNAEAFDHLDQYNQIVQVYFSDFFSLTFKYQTMILQKQQKLIQTNPKFREIFNRKLKQNKVKCLFLL